MSDSPRIEELKRRVDNDPASIAFAQLAEEYRRAGDFEQAVKVSRAGLEKHPTYISARVTLGRALLELGQLDEAQTEFDYVLLSAPDNLVALRSMAEIHQRRDATAELGTPDSELGTGTGNANPEPGTENAELQDPALIELESWLAAILADRAARAAS